MKEPWRFIDARHITNSRIPGMIEPLEQRMLYWAARDFVRGRGQIAEVGTFVGLSSHCLASGLRDNKCRDETLLHSYDRFLIDDHNTTYIKLLDGVDPSFRGSFFHLFKKYTAPLSDYIRPTMGDIFTQDWSGEPIEVMFLNSSTPRDLVGHVFDTFFPSIVDGGLVIFQDFFFYRSYWLSALVAALHSELMFLGQAHTSAAFLVRDASAFKTKFAERVPTRRNAAADSRRTDSLHGRSADAHRTDSRHPEDLPTWPNARSGSSDGRVPYARLVLLAGARSGLRLRRGEMCRSRRRESRARTINGRGNIRRLAAGRR